MDGLAGQLSHSEPMSRHTSWRTGGAADWFYRPNGKQDLSAFLKRLPAGVPVQWFGLGSNSLVRDGGYRGVVVWTFKGLSRLTKESSHAVYAEAGVTCAKLARFAAGKGLSGAEFMVGIPGTVGGALAMNAGCFGYETWPVVRRAQTVNAAGHLQWHSASAVKWGYRSCELADDEWFTGAEFDLTPCENDSGTRQMKKYLKRRAATQPIGLASAGSVFRNPPRHHAAQLIETAGLKGYAVGDACVSPKHANFIINSGNATSEDIENLIYAVRRKVAAVHGITLQLEVKIFGEAAALQ